MFEKFYRLKVTCYLCLLLIFSYGGDLSILVFFFLNYFFYFLLIYLFIFFILFIQGSRPTFRFSLAPTAACTTGS